MRPGSDSRDDAVPLHAEQFNVVAGDPLRLPGAIRVTDQKNATGQSVRASALSAGSTYQATLKLFGLFPLKDVKVKVVDQPLVIPCGVPFGIKMYTDGVLVVSMSDVDTATGPFQSRPVGRDQDRGCYRVH